MSKSSNPTISAAMLSWVEPFGGKTKFSFFNIIDNILPSNGPKQRLRPLGVVTTKIYEQDLICRRKGSSMNSKGELQNTQKV